MIKAEAQERGRLAEELATERREAAVSVLSLMTQRAAAVAGLDDAFHAVDLAVDEVDRLTNEIKGKVIAWLPSENGVLQRFLMDIGAIGMADILNAVPALPGRYAPGLATTKTSALRALREGLPEVEDKAVKDEARAAARALIARKLTAVRGQTNACT